MSAFSVFFDRRKQKKNTQTPTAEEYYRGRAHRISQVRYTCLLLTVLLLAYGFAVHGEELSLDSFRYMLKFLDFTEEEQAEGEIDIRFDYSERNKGIVYKGDIAVLGSDGLSVYSWDADRLFTERFRMEDPRLAVTPQSLFVYDLGGNEVRMFNSYSQIARLIMEYPVYGFSASEAGPFAVITSEKNYRTTVVVYDANARFIYKRSFSNLYADQISLSPDGTCFTVLGHTAQDGNLLTVLQRFSLKEEQPQFSATFPDELPLKLCYLSDERYAVLTGSALRIYAVGNDQPESTLPVEDLPLTGCSFAEGRILLTHTADGLSGGTVLRVYDQTLALLTEVQYEGDLMQKTVYDGALCVLTMGSVTVTPLSGGEPTVYPVDKDAVCVLRDPSGALILFEKGRAYHLVKGA